MKLIAGMIIITLAGCAGVENKELSHSKKVEGREGVEKKAQKIAKEEKAVVVEKETAISPEVLYLLMTAEIAGQRKEYGVALEGYLQAAKHVKDPEIAERAAKIGLFLKDTKKTDEAVSLWLKRDEKNLTARKIAVLSSLRGSDKEVAVEHLDQILKDDPAGFEATLMDVVKILEKDGNTAFVFDVMEDVAIKHPDKSVVFFVQALLAGQLNKQDEAVKKVNTALKIQPDWDKALILRAQLAVHGGNLALARKDLERLLEKMPDNIRIQKMLAQVLVKEEDYNGALQAYNKILKTVPDDGDAQFSTALIYLHLKKETEATEVFEKLINKPGWDASSSFYLGRIEFNNKNYDRAIVWFDKVTKGPLVYESSMAAISVFLSQKNYKEALSRIEKVSTDFPEKKLSTQLLEVEVYNSQKKHKKAFKMLTELLKEFPGNRDLLYTRALIAENLDKLDVVESDLKQVLQKKPNDINALNALGYTLADRTERFEDAEKYLSKAMKLSPNEAVIIDSFGWLRFKQGKVEEALNYLQNAYEKQAENEIAGHLIQVLSVMGRKIEAKKIFDKAYQESPDDEYLNEVKGLLVDVKE